MDRTVLIVMFVVAAAAPVAALAWSLIEWRLLTSKRSGYGLSDYLHSDEGVRATFRSRIRDLLLVGGGVVLASVAGVLSLTP